MGTDTVVFLTKEELEDEGEGCTCKPRTKDVVCPFCNALNSPVDTGQKCWYCGGKW